MANWGDKLEKLCDRGAKNLEEFSRAIKISLFNGVIRDTRVDTGRLRGNWQTSTGEPTKGEIDRLDKMTQGVDGGAAQEEVLRNITAYGKDYMTNNLPYAQVYEEKDAMIGRNVARIEQVVKEKIREVRLKR